MWSGVSITVNTIARKVALPRIEPWLPRLFLILPLLQPLRWARDEWRRCPRGPLRRCGAPAPPAPVVRDPGVDDAPSLFRFRQLLPPCAAGSAATAAPS